MVLRGESHEDLLDTYDHERRPVGVFTTEQAYSRYVTRTAPYLGTDGIDPVAPDLDVELGYRYASSGLCHDGDPGPLHENPRDSRARVGTRAPHVWVQYRGERISTIDLFDGRFVALGGRTSHSWCAAARAVESHVSAPFTVHQIGASDLDDPDDAFSHAYNLSGDAMVLVRPDGFVCWRSKTPAGSPSALAAALSQATFHPVTVS
jgi:hypothetical protein